MTTPDDVFLEEVDGFLSECTLPTVPSPLDTPEEFPPTCPTPKSTAIVSKRPRKTRVKLDAEAKRELDKAKDRQRRSTYRERRKTEREKLRQEIDQLMKKLQRAQGGDNFYASAWKMLAERQRGARLDAEEEQRQLCESIHAHSAILERFRALVDERLAGVGNLLRGGTSSSPFKRVRVELSDDEIFAAYIGEMTAVYAQTEKFYDLEDWTRRRPIGTNRPKRSSPTLARGASCTEAN